MNDRVEIDTTTPEGRRLRARIGAAASWANTENRTARTANGRAAAEAAWLKRADGDPERAKHLRQLHMLKMAAASAAARRARRATLYRPFEPDLLHGDAAAEFLGLQRNCWQRAITKGGIKRYHPTGVKRGYFALAELQRLKALRIDWSDAASIAAGYAVVLAEQCRENE